MAIQKIIKYVKGDKKPLELSELLKINVLIDKKNSSGLFHHPGHRLPGCGYYQRVRSRRGLTGKVRE